MLGSGWLLDNDPKERSLDGVPKEEKLLDGVPAKESAAAGNVLVTPTAGS